MFVPAGMPNHPSRNLVSIDYITIHETGNTNRGADAAAHARLQHRGGGGRQASWHYTVDDKEIWQSFHDHQMCWHTGTRQGNEHSIGIEICVNIAEKFLEACDNAAWLASHLMSLHGLSADQLVQHHFWSGKNCPSTIRKGTSGINWQIFTDKVNRRGYPANWAEWPGLPDYLRYSPSQGERTSHSVVSALVEAGVSFNIAHWENVFAGRTAASKDWYKILCSRAIESQWERLLQEPDTLADILAVIINKNPQA